MIGALIAFASTLAYLAAGAVTARRFFGMCRAADIDDLCNGDFRVQQNPATRLELARERWDRQEHDGTMFGSVVLGIVWPLTCAVAGLVWLYRHPVAAWLDSAQQQPKAAAPAAAQAREDYIRQLEAERTSDVLDVLAVPVLHEPGQVLKPQPPTGPGAATTARDHRAADVFLRDVDGRLVDVRTFADGVAIDGRTFGTAGALCICGIPGEQIRPFPADFVKRYSNPGLIGGGES